MQITRQADYAVRAVLYLAQHGPDGRVSTAQIARAQNIPSLFLAKIVSQLAAAGIVRATRGPHGGVALARPSDEISMLEIVETIDGPLTLNECVADPERCTMNETCPLRTIWCEAQMGLVKKLSQTDFRQLAHSKSPEVLLPSPVTL